MKNVKRLTMGILLAVASSFAAAGVQPGKAAPDFTLKDGSGKAWTLSALKGKIVVLEWNNPDCPYVRKHYDTGNMQKVQKEAGKQGVVWLAINSSAHDKQGHLEPEDVPAAVKKDKLAVAAYLLDVEGKVGHRYGAKTTPHMFVIDEKGTLAYLGAIDDQPTFDKKTVKGADNYVRAAIKALKAGAQPKIAETKPYGCSVKY